MQKLILYIFLATLCPFFKQEVKAQDSQKHTIKPLKIGDYIPEELWNVPLKIINHPEGKATITLNDYRGKLIILDFWATWCSSCVAAMPKIHQVAKQFKDNLVILPVTYEERSKVQPFIKVNQTLSSSNFSTIYADNLLTKAFPHRILPHCTWISADGRVITESLSDEITIKNINLVLDNNSQSIAKKVDLNPEDPIFLRKDLLTSLELKSYGILFKGHYDGLGSGQNDLKTDKGILRGKTIRNLPLIEIYTGVIRNLFSSMGDTYDAKRLDVKVSDKTQLIRDYTQPNNSFLKSNYYTYSIVVPTNKINDLDSYMLNDLNRYTSYHGRIEKRKTKCLILRRISRKDKISTKGGEPFSTLFSEPISRLQNLPASLLAAHINALDIIKYTVLDETHYKTNVDINLTGKPDFPTLQRELRTFDLELREGIREINFFVITDQ